MKKLLSITLLAMLITIASFAQLPPIGGPTVRCLGDSASLFETAPHLGIWSNSNPAVCNVVGYDTGAFCSVYPISPGTATITYSAYSIVYPPPLYLPDTIHYGTTAIIFTVLPVPGPITGTTSLCVGANTTLSDTSSGGTWTSTNPAVATIDSASGLLTGVSSGATYITYTKPNGCFTSVPIFVNPLPAAIGGPSTVCISETITLTDVTSGGTWSRDSTDITVGATTGVVTGVAAGTAIVTYTIPPGCKITKSLTVNPLPLVYTVTGGGSYCAGDTGVHIGLDGSNIDIQYQLYQGVTASGPPIDGTGAAIDFGLLTVAGTYTVSATATITGCTNNMTGSVTVSINPLPIVYTVSGSGSFFYSTTVTLSSSESGVDYQLFNSLGSVGSPKPGTGSPIIDTVTSSGTYFIVAINTTTACTDTMTDTAAIIITTITFGVVNHFTNKDIVISPNPAHQLLTIKAPELSRVQIYDLIGRTVIDDICNGTVVIEDVGQLKQGIYFARINDQFVQKIIKE